MNAAEIDARLAVASAGSIDKGALASVLKEMLGLEPSPVGEAGEGFTALEYGSSFNRTTRLVVDTTLPAIAGGANLSVGRLAYTFPAGIIQIDSSAFSIEIKQTEDNITADTPEVGLGTTVGTGAVAVLSSTLENILEGTVAADCDGTATVAGKLPTGGSPLIIGSASAHTVYLNVADGWAASGDAGALLTGTITLNWRLLL